jgi:hypothetical protein
MNENHVRTKHIRVSQALIKCGYGRYYFFSFKNNKNDIESIIALHSISTSLAISANFKF